MVLPQISQSFLEIKTHQSNNHEKNQREKANVAADYTYPPTFFSGHIARGSVRKTLPSLLEKLNIKKGRWRKRKWWTDNIKVVTGKTLAKNLIICKDRKEWTKMLKKYKLLEEMKAAKNQTADAEEA